MDNMCRFGRCTPTRHVDASCECECHPREHLGGYMIAKSFEFSAAHQLRGLTDDHPCSRLHGHTYVVTLVLTAADVDERGFAGGVDYRDLDKFKTWLKEHLDHRNLNDCVPFQTSVENMARFIYDAWAGKLPLSTVRLSETPSTWAEYRR